MQNFRKNCKTYCWNVEKRDGRLCKRKKAFLQYEDFLALPESYAYTVLKYQGENRYFSFDAEVRNELK